MGEQQAVLEHGEVVRWLGSYGFVSPEVGGEDGDLYVSFKDIEAYGFRQLKPGQRVIFRRVKNGQRGERAVNVRVVAVEGNR